MKKTISLLFVLLGFFVLHPLAKNNSKEFIADKQAYKEMPERNGEKLLESLYNSLPENRMSWEAFKYAMLGRELLIQKGYPTKSNILTIIDFSKSSTAERFFVLDIEKVEILFSTLTSHGQNTGENMALHFSNRLESHQSSPGFYKTAETYYGSKGFSLRLDGLEPGINCNARKRAIVIHAANYVSDKFIKSHGRLGRSFGCPALPVELNRPIIETIKEGSLLFIYTPSKEYRSHSEIFRDFGMNLFTISDTYSTTG